MYRPGAGLANSAALASGKKPFSCRKTWLQQPDERGLRRLFARAPCRLLPVFVVVLVLVVIIGVGIEFDFRLPRADGSRPLSPAPRRNCRTRSWIVEDDLYPAVLAGRGPDTGARSCEQEGALHDIGGGKWPTKDRWRPPPVRNVLPFRGRRERTEAAPAFFRSGRSDRSCDCRDRDGRSGRYLPSARS